MNGIAVSQDKADDNDWTVGDTVPVLFAKTGVVPLTVQAIYDRTQFAGNYVISLADVRDRTSPTSSTS